MPAAPNHSVTSGISMGTGPPRPFLSEIYLGEYERHVGWGGRGYLFQDDECTHRHVGTTPIIIAYSEITNTPVSFKHFYEY